MMTMSLSPRKKRSNEGAVERSSNETLKNARASWNAALRAAFDESQAIQSSKREARSFRILIWRQSRARYFAALDYHQLRPFLKTPHQIPLQSLPAKPPTPLIPFRCSDKAPKNHPKPIVIQLNTILLQLLSQKSLHHPCRFMQLHILRPQSLRMLHLQ